VLHGEQHFYDFTEDGWAKEPRIRLAGEHGFSNGADKYPHREVGGPDGCVAFFSIRGEGPNAVMYEAYDDFGKLICEVTLETIVADFEANT
jgi:hypothetical protein